MEDVSEPSISKSKLTQFKDQDLFQIEEPLKKELIEPQSVLKVFDPDKSDTLQSIKSIEEEYDEYLHEVEIYKERIRQKEKHAYNDMNKIRIKMEIINRKKNILHQMRKELRPEEIPPTPEKISKHPLLKPSTKTRSSKSKKRNSRKLNFKSITRQVKKTSDNTTPKQEVVNLEGLLAKENTHLDSLDRERLCLLIYSLASCIPLYLQELDQEIKKIRNQIASRKEYKNEQKTNLRKIVLKNQIALQGN